MEHCEWDQVRLAAQEEERGGMESATILILLLCFWVGFGVGTAFYAVMW